jgi:hypothetical protein
VVASSDLGEANGDFDRQRDVDIFIQYAFEKSR